MSETAITVTKSEVNLDWERPENLDLIKKSNFEKPHKNRSFDHNRNIAPLPEQHRHFSAQKALGVFGNEIHVVCIV